MNGKLIGVSINGERIDCQPDSALELEHAPQPVAWTSIAHQEGIDFKEGDKIDAVEFERGIFTGFVSEVNDKEVIIYLYL